MTNKKEGISCHNTRNGRKDQRNSFVAKAESSLLEQLRPGRHACRCQARIHGLVRNCLGCGKIVCEQEGSGPCFFCGELVCTKEEREILNRGSRKSAELYEKLMGQSYEKNASKGLSLATLSKDFETAKVFRNKLLAADADSERRTKVNDLQCDYSTIGKNEFLTKEERNIIAERSSELQRIKDKKRKMMFVGIDLVSMSVVQQERRGVNDDEHDPALDPVIREILDGSELRYRSMDNAFSQDVYWVPKGYTPKYAPVDISHEIKSNIDLLTDVFDIGVLSEELLHLEVERRGYCISLTQPHATMVANGLLRAVRWPEEVHVKGPVFVSSLVERVSRVEIEERAQKYIDNYEKMIKLKFLNFPMGCILGRVQINACLTIQEFLEEFDGCNPIGFGDFVLMFGFSELVVTPVPHISPSARLYQVDKALRDTLLGILR